MANEYFKFKRFTVHQDKCAMKVGTDGTLLGAWAQAPQEPSRILDIGTGTGLIALMMAQRYPNASIVGIDIDPAAVAQARDNVTASPFADRISIYEADICHFDENATFDSVICNPPFFTGDLICPDTQRAVARHTISLSYHNLISSAYKLLSANGCFSVIIPIESQSNFESEALMGGFYLSRLFRVKTTPVKKPKRCLIEFKKIPVSKVVNTCEVIETNPGIRSDWYKELTRDFYIR